MTPNPLEPDPETLKRWTDTVVTYALDHVAGLSRMPSWDTEGADAVVRAMHEPVPEKGRALEDVLARLDPAVTKSFNAAGPGYLAYIPGGGIPTAGLADLIACFTNRFVNATPPAPALAEIEKVTLGWLAQIMGMPDGANGVFTSGGSISNLAAIVAARVALLGEEFADGVMYFSEDTHACIPKAAKIAGFPERAFRRVPVDARRRLVVADLERMIADDKAAGRRPFLVVANAGTTNTGAVDPLPEMLAIARRHGLWAHADAAYGGFFRIAERGETLLPAIGDYDSMTLDPHKGLFLPYGTGVLLMRDPEALRRAHRSSAAYLQDVTTDQPLGFTDYSPELSRDFRGLRLWLPFQVHGVAAFRAQLTEKLALARRAYDALRSEPLLAMVDEPQLSIVAFSARPPAGHALDANAFGAELLRRVNARKRVFMSSTTIEGRYVLRICVLSFRTHEERIDDAVTGLLEEARALAAGVVA